MQILRHQRLAQQLNQTAMALMAEARMTAPDQAKELRELATEIDRIRVTMFANRASGGSRLSLPPMEAA